MSFEEKTTYYDPSESDEFVVLPKGQYKSRVNSFEYKKTWTNNENQVADIYEATYKLDNSVAEMILRNEKGDEISGSQFVNREVKSKGFFLWKSPAEDENFKANPGGNKRISIFLAAAGYKLEKKELSIKGNKREVTVIPETIDETRLMGQPVIIEVTHEEYKDKIYAKEIKVSKWDGAPAPVEENDDLPF